MKKIILNGCSWVAGDEILWAQFLIENNQNPDSPDMQWNNDKHTLIFKELQNKYRTLYRGERNQGGMLSKELNTEVIDLSQDGNSNDNIALSTISKILTISKENRHNYHVIVGWTVKERRLLHIDNCWENVHISHCNKETGNWPKWRQRLAAVMLEETDADWYINYFKNLIMLENFLKINNVTYTFYRSLGSKNEFYNFSINKQRDVFKIKLFNNLPQHSQIRLESLTPESIDSSNWLTFYEHDKDIGLASDSWTKYMQKEFDFQWYIREDNRHPNLTATQKLVEIIKDHLLKNNLLN